MAPAADAPWGRLVRQTLLDLQTAPGRFEMTWKVSLLCALVAAVAMLFKVPEAAIGCYLVIYLSRPSGATNVGQAIGVIGLASVVVFALAPVIQATADLPLLRICVIALVSFTFVFLGAASRLGEQGSIVALVIAFVLTLVDQLPIGEIATRGLLYAWQMAVMPMVLMILFNLVFGTSPHRLLRRRVAERLEAAAAALSAPAPERRARLDALLSEGLEPAAQDVMQARLFHTAPVAEIRWLSGAARTTYRLLLAVSALPDDVPDEVRATLARTCRNVAESVKAGHRPDVTALAPNGDSGDLPAQISAMLADLGAANGGSDAAPPKVPFLFPDAFSNPDYQRYALKTTAAAILCYLIYSLINWQGIHTAMITCYVAALGTTAETVHKLVLRISGCLVGAAIGLFSILFVIPHLESVGGLMALVFLGLLPAAWVAAGSERISYAGVQVGLAFLLTVLNGFGPSLDMDSARDRVVGILLGNLVVYVMFTTIWPKSALQDVRVHLSRILSTLAQIAARDPAGRADAVNQAALVETEAEKACQQLLLLPFEPASQQPRLATVAGLAALIEKSRDMVPALMFGAEPDATLADRLSRAAAGVSAEAVDGPSPSGDGAGVAGGSLADRARRIERWVAG